MFSSNLVLISVGTTATSVLWFGFYKYLRIKYKFGGECVSRIIASAHALVVTILSCFCYFSGPDPFLEQGSENTVLHELTLVVSLGYFAYDMIWCLVHDTEPPIMLFHHAASLAAMWVIVWSGTSGAEAVTGLGSLEVTNPLLQARWFLKTSGYNHTPIHSIIEISFVFLFFAMRIVFGTYLFFSIMGSPSVGFIVQLSSVGLYAISVIFMAYIARFVFKKYILGIRTKCCDFTCSETNHIPVMLVKTKKEMQIG